MAIIRAELVGRCNKLDPRSAYDAIVDSTDDLNTEETSHWAIGSLAMIKSTQDIYIKGENETWTEVGA